MKLYKSARKKTKAQAMVEFAIVLPLLLVLLYGILEAGRLLFIYSTIVTASRQAVRYGSATGEGSTAAPRYQDCAQIRAAAQKVDFLNAFDDSDIVINYDSGPGTALLPFSPCDGSVDTGVIPSANNTTRLLVTIDGDYLPILRRLVPFVERSTANSNPIHALSARTILVSVPIVVTIPPSTFLPSTPTSTPTSTATPTFTPTNTPTRTPTPTVVFTNTPSITPTRTITPTVTLTATTTNTPTITPTVVTGCGSLAAFAGQITRSGTTMRLTIPNNNPYPVMVQDLFVIWNNDKGHQSGTTDKTLTLLSAGLLGAPSPFWTGSPTQPAVGPSAFLTTHAVFPANTTSTLVFTFDKTYDNFDNSERIFINLLTPGCENSPIDRHR